MNFIIDAHLPPRLAALLISRGHDAVHTRELPAANATPDGDIVTLAGTEQRVIVTKDRDFLDSHRSQGWPERLLVVATGNASRGELLDLFDWHLAEIVDLFTRHTCVELGRSGALARA